MLKLMIYQNQKKKKEPAEESTKEEEEEPVQSAASWEELSPDQKRVNPIWQFFTLFFGFCFLSLFSFL